MTTPFTHRSHKGLLTLVAFACVSSFMLAAANAQITTVFYILLENRCFTSGTDTSQSNILFNNKNGGAPWTTALCTPGSTAYTFNYQGQTISQTAHTSFCSAYHNAFANAGGASTTTNTIGTENANNTGTAASPITTNPVHPSEPNYVFMEAGSNLSKLDDNDPYFLGASVQQIATFLANNPSYSGENLCALLQNAGISWTSYSEGTCLLNSAGQDFNLSSGVLTNNPAPLGTRTVPLVSFSGPSSITFIINSTSAVATTTGSTANIRPGMFVTGNFIPVGTTVVSVNSNSITMSSMPTALANLTGGTTGTALSGSKSEGLLISAYQNQWNGSTQYNFATKHTGSLFFPATNGSGTASTAANQLPTNSAVEHYEALESLQADLANNTQAAYCVITPDQFNDGHTALSNTFAYPNYGGTNSGVTNYYQGTSDLARVAQMDCFCSQIVPMILASPVYQAGHAAIVIWTDETEGSPQNDYYHTLQEMVISPYAKGNAYNSTLNYTHSSDLATMQKIFGVVGNTATGYLNDAANASNATVGSPVTNTGTGLQTATGLPYPGFGTGTATDLSDLFVPGTIPANIPTVVVTASGYMVNARTHSVTQTVTLTNALSGPLTNPLYLVLGNLSSNTSLVSETPVAATGTTATVMPGSPYIQVAPSGLAAGASVTFSLKFAYPSSGTISDTLTTYSAGGTP